MSKRSGLAKAQRHPARRPEAKGFTIIELLLAITIIGLILSFSVTAWLSMKSSQQISSTAALLKTAGQCLESYVIQSGKVPPQAYFISHCGHIDPWGNMLQYENNGENEEIANVATKTFRDAFGDHPDAAWIIASYGPDRTRDFLSSATLWNCSTGDDLCQMTSKNELFYEITK